MYRQIETDMMQTSPLKSKTRVMSATQRFTFLLESESQFFSACYRYLSPAEMNIHMKELLFLAGLECHEQIASI